MPANDKTAFKAAVVVVAEAMEEAETFPVIPREIEFILTIKTSERHRWLADRRLPSSGTRTVRLNGRARQITFHVFDARVVEDLLNRGVVDQWREDDAASKEENRQKRAYQAMLTRSLKMQANASRKTDRRVDNEASELRGWEEFDRDGFLR